MKKTKFKNQYFAPALSLTELTKEDIIMSSVIEQPKGVVIENGDWTDSLASFLVEEIS